MSADLLRRAARVAFSDPDPRWAPVARLLNHWAWLAGHFPDQLHRRDADPVLEIARALLKGPTDE